MSQIPSFVYPSVVEGISSTQGDNPIDRISHPRKTTTNVTLNPSDTSSGLFPQLRSDILQSSQQESLNGISGRETGKRDLITQSMAMETSNTAIAEQRNIITHDGKGELPPHHQTNTDYNLSPRHIAARSVPNPASEHFSSAPSRTPPHQSGMPGYQPMTPQKRQQKSITPGKSGNDVTGKKTRHFVIYFKFSNLYEYPDYEESYIFAQLL